MNCGSRHGPRLRRHRRPRRPRHRDRLLTGSRGRLTVLAVVAEEVDVVADVGRSEIRDLEVGLPDRLRLAGDVLDARQSAEGAPIGYLVPVQMFNLLLRIAAAGEQPANIVVAAHTFWDYLLDEVAGNREKTTDYSGVKATITIL